ncbi:MAG: asparagine synthase-related protein, partial [Acidobacteria bacterium]|nr:asparagine synthase-related protein [Acidobacteriota bacterium]
LGMLYRAFATTRESRGELQPFVSSNGNVMLWDGRLDNRSELLEQLNGAFFPAGTDVAIVMAAYEQWETDCFRRLIGDWALSVWDAREQVVLLAKDFVGSRHLHYSISRERVEWCTVLDPLVLLAGHSFALSEEYVAGYIGHFPPDHVTPYLGIDSVPAGAYVKVRKGTATVRNYWQFQQNERIRYHTDAEYEEHFRSVFAQSIRRRLRSDAPILAELSGGMDSSSIVCMADVLIARGEAETPRLDTVSYYDDKEPNWDERPYFVKVEEKRGRKGCHVDMGQQTSFAEPMDGRYFCPLPGASKAGLEFEERRVACMESAKNRVLLSGIGGDECLGGVPTPIPELCDLMVQGRLIQLARQLKTWSLVKKRPWAHLLFEALGEFLPPSVTQRFKKKRIAPWLHPQFVRHHQAALLDSGPRTRLARGLPSYQSNVNALAALRRQLGNSIPSIVGCYDVSYPCLDRDLIEFLYSIPRDQILRPGQRRSLMRRALVGITPDEILNRKRKAYVSRRPLMDIEMAWPSLVLLSERSLSDALGITDRARFAEALQAARQGHAPHLVWLVRMLKLELWLQHASSLGALRRPAPNPSGCRSLMHLEESAQASRPCFPHSYEVTTCSSQLTIPKQKGGETHEIRKATTRVSGPSSQGCSCQRQQAFQRRDRRRIPASDRQRI